MCTFDKIAPRYDRLMAPLERHLIGRWREETFGLLPAESRILEIGAGTGANFRHYHPSCRHTASEPSAEMIAVARTKTDRFPLVRADAQNLPFVDNSFDAAVATLVFCSIPEPSRAFAELRRVVRKGGRLVLLEHVRPPGILGNVFDLLSKATVALIDDHFNRETARLAEESGFAVTETRSRAFGIFNIIVGESG